MSILKKQGRLVVSFYYWHLFKNYKTNIKKKPPISRRFRMCSVTVLLAPPIIQRCSQEFLNSPSSLHRNHTQSNP